jgi:DNA-binding protein YbaB
MAGSFEYTNEPVYLMRKLRNMQKNMAKLQEKIENCQLKPVLQYA